MNKLIQELVEKAPYTTVSTEGRLFTQQDLAKFAELIVRECLNVMSKTAEEANARFTYMGDDVPTVVHQMNIEKHFGVKE